MNMINPASAFVNSMVCKAMSEYTGMPSWAFPHLYFRRSTEGHAGDVLMVDVEASDAPDDFELAIPIQRSWDCYRVEREVRRAVGTMPILAY